jgi:purine-nucleoside phosphorylase
MSKKITNRQSSIVNRQSPIGYSEALRAARYVQSRSKIRPRVGIILGSGLSGVLGGLKAADHIPYAKVPHFPRPSVAGHAGVMHLGAWGAVPAAVLEGRMHLYEGYSPAELAFPTRVLALLGVRVLIATCAAGGIAPAAAHGTFMIFRDHLNYQGANPLAGPHDARWGERFVDLSDAYDPELRREARRAARACRVKTFEGVYAALMGPSYETPAEILGLRRLGAGAVGMSTVPEVLAARQAGLRVLAIATISNRAAGLSKTRLSHQEVLTVGKKAGGDLARLLDTLLPRLANL